MDDSSSCSSPLIPLTADVTNRGSVEPREARSATDLHQPATPRDATLNSGAVASEQTQTLKPNWILLFCGDFLRKGITNENVH